MMMSFPAIKTMTEASKRPKNIVTPSYKFNNSAQKRIMSFNGQKVIDSNKNKSNFIGKKKCMRALYVCVS